MQDEEGYTVLQLRSKQKASSCPPPDSHGSPHWQGIPPKVAYTVILILQIVMLVLTCSVLIQMKLMKSQAAESGTVAQMNNCLEKGLEGKPISKAALGRQTCPADWKLHRGHCYWFPQRIEKKTWNESKANCAKRHSNLAMIRDTCDLGFLWSHIPPSWYYWIGLHIPSPGSNWTWPDGSALDWSLFQVKPSGDEGTCAVLSRDGIYPESCENVLFWICEQ
ncbi:killer cell lectin-like receptor subfamily F member 1 [Tachyglossus aculeatus]|uniref:killer cell lectin-like receptor subfamily F member 1 n=1 Tax=Tachyglossus aculeatus TaxID=9261 RepID=UPI0018F4D182|nr:killer cell lectin-like receptor subfamily F member 1 [Tachyglossus aculeatus]